MTRPLKGFGLGLRPGYYEDALAPQCTVDWFEIVSENYMVAGGRPHYMLDQIAERHPLAMHGVSLSIGGCDPLDRDYLHALKTLQRRVRPRVISDHLCWTGGNGVQLHDLLPLPQTEEAVRHVAARVREVQDALGQQILLENVSSYLRFSGDTLDEARFLSAIVAESGCGLLLDVNNVWVNGHNHGFDPYAMLDALAVDAVGQIHLAGHSVDALGSGLLVDTHDQPVCDDVWNLYAHAVRRFGDVPAMIERDDNFPPFTELLAELAHARDIAATAAPQREAA